MNTFLNIIWFLLGGLLITLLYYVAAIAMCITIIGIPFGIGLFRIGSFAAFPFGKTVSTNDNSGCISIALSVLWIFFGWWEIALVHLLLAFIFMVTIIGIPFAAQHWKLVKMSFLPFITEIKSR